MPLDSSIYTLSGLRLDGRRWNELRRLHAQMGTQAAADGSAYVEMGNTKIICTVDGPQEQRRTGMRDQGNEAKIEVELGLAGFSGVDRKRRARNDKRVQELQHTIATTFATTLFTHLYPHSTISIHLHVLSQDGSILAAALNAATLALIDAGIPMSDYIAACTVGSTAGMSEKEEESDPVLDVNGLEENELPFLTVGSTGDGDRVNCLVMETKCQVARLEGMLSVGLDGCRQIRGILDGVVRAHGRKLLQGKVS